MSSVTAKQPRTAPPVVAEPSVPHAETRTEAFRRVRSETLNLSRTRAVAAAKDHSSLPHSPTERERDPRRVRELVERIKAGVWLPCSWATVEYGGVKYRMNGMHSSEAMQEAADFLPEIVAIHSDHYEAPTGESMALLFRQFDARFSGRTKQDVAGAYQGLVQELQQIPRNKAKLGMEGIGWYTRVVEKGPTPSNDELYSWFFNERYHPFLRWLDKVLSIKTPEMIMPAVVGAMYGTFVMSESGAQEFWPHVAKQDLLDDSDARSVLSAELVRIKENRKDGVKPPTPVEIYAKCAKAWCAFRTGESIRTLNVNTKKGLPDLAA